MENGHYGRETTPVRLQSLGQTAVRLFPVTVILQLCSFLASLALAFTLGATYATDAYFLAISVPLLVFGAMQAAIRLGAIPALTEVQRRTPERLSNAASQLVTAVLVVSLGLVTVAAVLNVLALPLLVAEHHHRTLHLAQLLTIQMAPLGILGACSGALGAVLGVRGSFVAPVAVLCLDPLFRAAFVLALGDAMGVEALVLGQLLGNSLAVSLLWRLARRSGVDLRLVSFLRSPFVIYVLGFSAPLLIAQSVLQVNPVIDRTMAAHLSPGSVTVLDLAVGMFSVPVALVASTLIAPIVATWSSRYAEGGWPALRQSYMRAVRGVFIALPPLVILGFLLRRQLLTITYEWGAFSKEAAGRTAFVFGMLLLGLPAQTFVIFLSTLFVVTRNALFPMTIALVNVCLNVMLNFMLRPFLGVAGLALSTTVTYTLLCGVYAVVASRRFGPLGIRLLRLEVGVVLTASAVTVAIGSSLLAVLPRGDTKIDALSSVLAVSACAAGVYIFLLSAMTKSYLKTFAARMRDLARRRSGN